MSSKATKPIAVLTLPETNSEFTPEKWCLEDDPASYWFR